MDDPYTKREQDEWRSEIRDQFNRIEEHFKERQVAYEALMKSNADLAKIASHNSGQIVALWKAHEENKKANELIEDITRFWKVGKWFVYLVIGAGALFSAVKMLFFHEFYSK